MVDLYSEEKDESRDFRAPDTERDSTMVLSGDPRKASERIAYAIGEFALLATLALLPVTLVYIDDVVIGRAVGEELLVTENAQNALLLMSTLIFWNGAWRHPKSRGFLMLVAGFFSCALIREQDGVLDAIWHGFWFWPAVIVALSTISYVVAYCRNTVAGAMSDFVGTRPYFYIITGLIVLLVLSRTFGSGHMLWKDLLGVSYTPIFHRALQEGLELFGYVYVAYGSCVFYFKRYGS